MMFEGEPNGWSPIPELVRLDGDLALVFLSGNGVVFSQPMDDDWYRVTVPDSLTYTSDASGTKQNWRPNVSASPMGCLEQYQVCNSAYPKPRGCGPLASYMDAIYGAAEFFNVTKDALDPDRPLSSNITSARFIWPLLAMLSSPTSLTTVLSSLGTASLASQSHLYAGDQQPLPKNQWQLDVLRWWHIVLAAIQASR
jgi:hypothetical protein